MTRNNWFDSYSACYVYLALLRSFVMIHWTSLLRMISHLTTAGRFKNGGFFFEINCDFLQTKRSMYNFLSLLVLDTYYLSVK